MKKYIAILLSTLLTLQLCLPALAASGGKKVNTYAEGQFTDVTAATWCAANVKIAYEYGIMGGRRADYFDTEGNVTLAQAIVMACRVHDALCGKEPALPTKSGDPWYEPYLRYAEAHDFLGFSNLVPSDYDLPISRLMFAFALYNAIPEANLAVIGSVEDNAIPDLDSSNPYSVPVYALYRAGILTGNDAKGTFTPERPISRGAAAAVIGRIMDPSLRKRVELKEAPFEPVPLDRLANLKSLRRKANDAEMTEAYNAALQVVTPLARLSREEQLYGIAVALRQMFDSGMSYSMDSPHYNDPYGYFVLGTASCAGCTRATGLCLNMLGIPYEHVNENQYSHQWCRVAMPDGTYWICDAYGLYCGPEPAPYVHPYL